MWESPEAISKERRETWFWFSIAPSFPRILGYHRLLDGDATDTDAVARLMAGASADLVFTCNSDYEGYTEQRLTIKGDRLSDADFKQFLERGFHSYRTLVNHTSGA